MHFFPFHGGYALDQLRAGLSVGVSKIDRHPKEWNWTDHPCVGDPICAAIKYATCFRNTRQKLLLSTVFNIIRKMSLYTCDLWLNQPPARGMWLRPLCLFVCADFQKNLSRRMRHGRHDYVSGIDPGRIEILNTDRYTKSVLGFASPLRRSLLYRSP